uniref:Uncharacterized protein n=2 Tax=Attheya septentrionalis TaxID=420275 RepID=A0A7S2UHC4_9STRA|mmetsp:Transcript_23268/g.41993  ORF Transcript_23268/g.41993 Transcript_23268/m.41993 type:complete len:444 (+) Transcript_23268:68-1399(+)
MTIPVRDGGETSKIVAVATPLTPQVNLHEDLSKILRGLVTFCVYEAIIFVTSMGADSISSSCSGIIQGTAVAAGGSISAVGQYLFFFMGVCVVSLPLMTLVRAIRTLLLLEMAPGESGSILCIFFIAFPPIVLLWKYMIFGFRMFVRFGASMMVIGSTFIGVCPIMMVASARSSHHFGSTTATDARRLRFPPYTKRGLAKTMLLFLAQTVLVMYVFGMSRYFAWLPLMKGHPTYTYSGPMCLTGMEEVSWGGEWGCPDDPTTSCTVRVYETLRPEQTVGPNGEFYSYPSRIHSELHYYAKAMVSKYDGDDDNNVFFSDEECFAEEARFVNVTILGDCNRCTIPQIDTHEAVAMLNVLLGGILFYGAIMILIEASFMHRFFYKWFMGNEGGYRLAAIQDDDTVDSSVEMTSKVVEVGGAVAGPQGEIGRLVLVSFRQAQAHEVV